MIDEEINKAIAEACKWDNKPVVRTNGRGEVWVTEWPDYCHDLNAMHEAEKKLDDQQHHLFSDHLHDTECKRQKQTQKWRWLSATARQRAEAFLRTLGKWSETTEESSAVHIGEVTEMKEAK